MPNFPKPNKFSKKFKKRTPFKLDFVEMGRASGDVAETATINPGEHFTYKSDSEKKKEKKEKEENVEENSEE